jgi:hypothetical protein
MNERKSGGFSHGFLFGLLIGGLLVFLFGTKKGRSVVQALTEQVDTYMVDEEEDNEGAPSQESSPAHPVKRLFKGIRKLKK